MTEENKKILLDYFSGKRILKPTEKDDWDEAIKERNERLIKQLGKGGKEKMIEVDCRKCKNLSDNGCSLYGNDADVAVARCTENCFANYKIK